MSNATQRNYILGDEWIYYKIYTGQSTSDTILTDIILPISQSLLKEKIIDKWFFIRYSDPENHLRVRFHLQNSNDFHIVILKFKTALKQYIKANLIWNIQLDTYKQEIERYNGKKMLELSEDLFFHDSKMIAKFISLIEGEEGEELRWLFAIKAIDKFLDSFYFSITEKLDLLNRLKTGYANEFDMSRPLKKQLDQKYRHNREKIELFLGNDFSTNSNYTEIQKLLNEKEKKSLETIKKIIATNKKTKNDINNFLMSHIHMTMNRFFKSKGRVHELVIYDFLYRHYLSLYHKKLKVISE
ncbi:thiopeptide-type bacteriocin biosynthesis protein [Flavobacterium procerum]|uniref:Thiopeptide-type bacteriocin biosynthesis protein n=1 Tax=Flavobacterium procerum TaxID=1455569 RepID=A0ABV6BPA2_9FLAO